MSKKRKPAMADELLDELLEGTDALSAFRSGDLIQDLKKGVGRFVVTNLKQSPAWMLVAAKHTA